MLLNENSIREHLWQINFSMYYISYRRPYLWKRILFSENLTFSDSNFHQGVKCQLEQFILWVDIQHLEILKSLFFPDERNLHI